MKLSKETTELVRMSLNLKRQIVDYYKKDRDIPKYKSIIEKKFANPSDGLLDEVDGIDWFIHNYRFRNGDTFIDRFIRSHEALSKLEIEILNGWKDSVYSWFQVKSVDKETITLLSLLDGQEYITTSNLGTRAIKQFKVSHFVLTRLVPMHNIYLLSGHVRALPPDAKEYVESRVSEALKSNMKLTFGGNKNKIAEAWKSQKERRREFISYFGRDTIIVPGNKVIEAMNDFFGYTKSLALSRLPESEREKYKNIPFNGSYPDSLSEVDTVGIIFDEVEGINLYPHFDLFIAAFSNPSNLAKEEYREAVLGYLWSDTISPLPFKRMVEMYPENAGEVYKTLFKKDKWDNHKDFDNLMRKYKGRFLSAKERPCIIPVATPNHPARD